MIITRGADLLEEWFESAQGVEVGKDLACPLEHPESSLFVPID